MVVIERPTKIMNKLIAIDTPADGEALTFVAANDEWQPIAGGGGGQSNTSSNSGTGDGWALPKVASDLPFKSFIGELNKIILTANAADITATLGTDVVILTGAQTLTDKTLTAPIMTAPALGVVASGDISACTSINQVLVTPALGVPSALVLTNATGLVNAGVDGAAAIAVSKLAPITFTDVIPCVLEVPQGTDAFPDVHALATQGSKITGIVMPTATDSTINFKFICPQDLAATPGLIIRVMTLTLSANTTDAVNLTLSQRFIGDTENADQAFVTNDGVAAANYNVADTIESYDVHDMTPVNSPVAGDLCTGQIFRDISADAAGDVIIIGISAHIDRVMS